MIFPLGPECLTPYKSNGPDLRSSPSWSFYEHRAASDLERVNNDTSCSSRSAYLLDVALTGSHQLAFLRWTPTYGIRGRASLSLLKWMKSLSHRVVIHTNRDQVLRPHLSWLLFELRDIAKYVLEELHFHVDIWIVIRPIIHIISDCSGMYSTRYESYEETLAN